MANDCFGFEDSSVLELCKETIGLDEPDLLGQATVLIGLIGDDKIASISLEPNRILLCLKQSRVVELPNVSGMKTGGWQSGT